MTDTVSTRSALEADILPPQPASTRMRTTLASSLVALPLLTLLAAPAAVRGQDATSQGAPRVYLDCRGPECNLDYYRTELDWVAWVRDQADAHVYVILTSQQTGAGGREYVLEFSGRQPYQGYSAETRYRALATDTQRERLDGVALTLGLGLAQFATQSGFRDLVRIDRLSSEEEGLNAGGGPAGLVTSDQVEDPWDLWVFRLNANGDLERESSRSQWNLRTSLNVQRVTPTWKQTYNVNYNRFSQTIEYDDGRPPFEYARHDWGTSWRVAYALAEHFSVGFSGNVGRNTRNNQDIWGQFNPAIEYSFFPYEEATRRSLTVFYEIGPVYRHYFEETLLGETEETRAEQALSVGLEQRQPWGNAGVFLRGSTYLHDVGTNNVSLDGNLSFRVTRGLDLNVGASYSRIRDQIYLPGGNLTDEERLLRLQQEQTEYRVEARFGFSYQFGSLFNNVVNNRF